MSGQSEEFLAGWQAAREYWQVKGSVTPYPPQPAPAPEPEAVAVPEEPVGGEEDDDGGDS